MQRLREVPLLVVLMALSAAAMLLPAAHAATLRQHEEARAYFYSAVLVAILAVMLGIATARHRPRLPARAQLAAVAGAYLVLPPLLALPFLSQEGGDFTLADMWFEMLSAFTTTGATLFKPWDLTPTAHLWRALVGWAGGLYVLVVALAVLAPLNLGGMEVVSGRTPGRATAGTTQVTDLADMRVRMLKFAGLILPVYGGATLALWIALLMAGELGLIAFCHALSTVSTSGISPVGGLSGGTAGIWAEGVVALFLLPVLSRRPLAWAMGQRRGPPWHLDAELRTATVVLGLVVGLLMLRLWWAAAEAGNGADLTQALHALWGTTFTALSFLTTTGFESAWWRPAEEWSGLGRAGTVLWGLAILGGGIATTAGGVKLLRVAALFRHSQQELDRIIHPHSVGGSMVGRQIARQGPHLAWIFFLLFGMAIFAVSGALTLTGMQFEPALELSLAALSNTGPVVGSVPDLGASWSTPDTLGRIILGAAMMLGRLETLAVLALLLPDTWRG